MTPTSPEYRMADRILDGHLEETLRSLYVEAGSWEDVSRRLYAEHAITISGQTLRRWASALGIEAAGTDTPTAAGASS